MPKKITVAEYIAKALNLCDKSQREVAQEMGYPKPNVLSMMKQGMTKMPIEKAPLFARACGVDERFFTRLVMSEYFPEAWSVLQHMFGDELSANEREVVNAYRETVEEIGQDYAPDEHFRYRLKNALKNPLKESV